jgi:hypothetical protein
MRHCVKKKREVPLGREGRLVEALNSQIAWYLPVITLGLCYTEGRR